MQFFSECNQVLTNVKHNKRSAATGIFLLVVGVILTGSAEVAGKHKEALQAVGIVCLLGGVAGVGYAALRKGKNRVSTDVSRVEDLPAVGEGVLDDRNIAPGEGHIGSGEQTQGMSTPAYGQ